MLNFRSPLVLAGAPAGFVVAAAAWFVFDGAGFVTIRPTTVRDLAGYSLIVITLLFFATLFLDRSWTREER